MEHDGSKALACIRCSSCDWFLWSTHNRRLYMTIYSASSLLLVTLYAVQCSTACSCASPTNHPRPFHNIPAFSMRCMRSRDYHNIRDVHNHCRVKRMVCVCWCAFALSAACFRTMTNPHRYDTWQVLHSLYQIIMFIQHAYRIFIAFAGVSILTRIITFIPWSSRILPNCDMPAEPLFHSVYRFCYSLIVSNCTESSTTWPLYLVIKLLGSTFVPFFLFFFAPIMCRVMHFEHCVLAQLYGTFALLTLVWNSNKISC